MVFRRFQRSGDPLLEQLAGRRVRPSSLPRGLKGSFKSLRKNKLQRQGRSRRAINPLSGMAVPRNVLRNFEQMLNRKAPQVHFGRTIEQGVKTAFPPGDTVDEKIS